MVEGTLLSNQEVLKCLEYGKAYGFRAPRKLSDRIQETLKFRQI